MNEPLVNPGADTDKKVGRDIAQRIKIRERALLQARFLELLGQQSLGGFTVLVGPAALRGVYTRKAFGSRLDLEAPRAVASHFDTLCRSFTDLVEKQGDNYYTFKGKSSASLPIYLEIRIKVPTNFPAPPKRALFYGRPDKSVSVRVIPLRPLILGLLAKLQSNPTAADLLDLWLLCEANTDARAIASTAVAEAPHLRNPIAVLSDKRRARLAERWEAETIDCPTTVPPFSRVYDELKELLELPTTPDAAGSEQ